MEPDQWLAQYGQKIDQAKQNAAQAESQLGDVGVGVPAVRTAVHLGDPQAIAKMAENWRSAGTQVASVAADYAKCSVEQTRGWQGRSATGYRAASAKHMTGLETLSMAASGVSVAVQGAGQLVAAVRKMIMDLIGSAVADMVMKIIQWLAASFLTFGAAIGAAISDIVATACRYARKLADFLSKLASSLTKLMNLVKQVAQVARQVVQTITEMSHKGASGGGGGAPDNTRPSAGGLGLTDEQLAEMNRGANRRYTNPDRCPSRAATYPRSRASRVPESPPPRSAVPVVVLLAVSPVVGPQVAVVVEVVARPVARSSRPVARPA